MEFKIEKLQTFTGHKSSVYGLAKGENSNVFYSVAGDGYVVRWDIEKPEEGIPLLKLINNAYTLKYVAERKLMIVPDNQLGVHWVDVDSKKLFIPPVCPEYRFLILKFRETMYFFLIIKEVFIRFPYLIFQYQIIRCKAKKVQEQ